MLKIGDFARAANVTVKTLRFYAHEGLLAPVYIDRFSGYRYYTTDQLPTLNRILALKDLGFSLDQIHILLRESISPDELRGMLRLKQSELQDRLKLEQDRLARVEQRLRLIEQEGPEACADIVICQSIKYAISWISTVFGSRRGRKIDLPAMRSKCLSLRTTQ